MTILKHTDSFTVDTTTLTAPGLDYLLAYGFSQSLQDCVAGVAKEVRDTAQAMLSTPADAKVQAKWKAMLDMAGRTIANTDAGSPADVKAVVDGVEHAKKSTRFQAILAGTMVFGSSGGKRLDPTESVAWDIAELAISAAFARNAKLAATGEAKLLPKPKAGTKEWSALVDRHLEKNRDQLLVKAKRQLADAQKADDVDLAV